MHIGGIIQTYRTALESLLHVMWQPGWQGVRGRMDTCLWMADSLCCAPETVITLLIGYTPMQNKKLKNSFFSLKY